MQHSEKSFSQVIEQYTFKVANHFIGSVEPTYQTALINLVSMVSQSDNTTAVNGSSSSQPSEWETVLNEPVNWRSVHRQWFLDTVRERIKQHKDYEARLEQIMLITYHRLLAVQDSQLSEIRRSPLEAYYQQTLAVYERQLAKARDMYASHFAHLES